MHLLLVSLLNNPIQSIERSRCNKQDVGSIHGYTVTSHLPGVFLRYIDYRAFKDLQQALRKGYIKKIYKICYWTYESYKNTTDLENDPNSKYSLLFIPLKKSYKKKNYQDCHCLLPLGCNMTLRKTLWFGNYWRTVCESTVPHNKTTILPTFHVTQFFWINTIPAALLHHQHLEGSEHLEHNWSCPLHPRIQFLGMIRNIIHYKYNQQREGQHKCSFFLLANAPRMQLHAL